MSMIHIVGFKLCVDLDYAYQSNEFLKNECSLYTHTTIAFEISSYEVL